MSKTILDTAREITSKFQPETLPWKVAMSKLASEYFSKVGYSLDAAMQMETVAQQVTMEHGNTFKYLETKGKL